MSAKKKKEKIKKPPSIFRFFKRYKKYLPLLAVAIFTGLIFSATDGAFAIIVKNLIDETIDKDMSGFWQWFIYLGYLTIIILIAAPISRYTSGKYSNLIVKSIRKTVGGKLATVKLSWIDKHKSGDLLSRVGNDIGVIIEFFENQFTGFTGAVTRFIISLAIAIYLSWELTIISFALVPILIVVTMKVSKPVEKLAAEQSELIGDATSIAQDSVSGQAEIKSFTLHDWIEGRFSVAIDKWVEKSRIVALVRAKTNFVNAFSTIIPIMVMSGLGVWFIILGRMTVGELMAFIQVSNGLVNPLSSIGNYITSFRSAAGASRRIWEIIDAPSETFGSIEFAQSNEKPFISLNDVSFSYTTDTESRSVFEKLNLQISNNESVALVGESGCGKSTLIKLIAGFYQPTDGKIKISGVDLSELDIKSFRRNVAMVQQETFLFPEPLDINIGCGLFGSDLNVDDEIIKSAAKSARLHGYITSLDNGYKTVTGERGSRLSGGQRQRVAIARAMIRNCQLLLLDEPTSALDTITENDIQRELDELMKDRTTIIIAHRLSTIKNVDRIIVLDGGKVVEQGSHMQLMALGAKYYQLYNKQFEIDKERNVEEIA